MSLREDAGALAPDLVRFRRELHRQPEVGLELPRTQERVLAALDGLPLDVTTGRGLSSVTAVLRGGAAAPGGQPAAVLLRGDMDALPVAEATGVDYASGTGDTMHACGHDLHTAMLVGAARLLSARRERLPGDVVFMFQPGEEGWDGAGHMIDEGVLDAAGPRVAAGYGLHVTSAGLPRGIVGCRPGPMLSASDALMVTVRGVGGHGAMPHRAKDPVPVAAEMVGALQTLVTRQHDIFDPVVLTVGVLRAGTKRNIIPDTARLECTVRSYSAAARARIKDGAVALLRGIAAAHGVEADIDYRIEYPVTVNDAEQAGFLAETAREVLGEERFAELPHPVPASEDFSRVLAAVPGSFAMLGAAPEGVDPEKAANNHSPFAVFDDAVLPDGAALLAELAVRRLDLTGDQKSGREKEGRADG
jgi:hippurate hydrolase